MCEVVSLNELRNHSVKPLNTFMEPIFRVSTNGDNEVVIYVRNFKEVFTFKDKSSVPDKVSICSHPHLPSDVKTVVESSINYGQNYWTDCDVYYVLFDNKLAGYFLDSCYGNEDGYTFFNTDEPKKHLPPDSDCLIEKDIFTHTECKWEAEIVNPL